MKLSFFSGSSTKCFPQYSSSSSKSSSSSSSSSSRTYIIVQYNILQIKYMQLPSISCFERLTQLLSCFTCWFSEAHSIAWLYLPEYNGWFAVKLVQKNNWREKTTTLKLINKVIKFYNSNLQICKYFCKCRVKSIGYTFSNLVRIWCIIWYLISGESLVD